MSDEEAIALPVSGSAQVDHLLAVGQSEKAAEVAARLLAESPSDPFALAALGRVRLAMKDLEGAQAAIDEAVGLDPESPGFHMLRGVFSLRRGKFAEAERSYLKAIELDPEGPAGHFCYGELLWICDQDRAALPAVRRSLELDPDDTDAHQLLAKVLLATNPRHWDLSLEAARRALQLDPDDSAAHAVHGAALLHAARRLEAEGAFRSALEIEPTNALARHGLTQALLSKAWWYRPFFQIQLWSSRYGTGAVFAILIGLWFVVSATTATLSRFPSLSPYLSGLTWAYLGFCAYTWFATPITRALLNRQYPWMRELP